MKAEHRKALEKNELAEKLTHAWEGVSSTSPGANRAWIALLSLFILGIAWYLYSNYTTSRDAARWNDLTFATDVKSLQKIVEEGPGSVPGNIARFQIARLNVTDAANKVAAQNGDDRAAAADTLEAARKIYSELAGVSNLPKPLIQEAMLELAQLEELLASVPKADSSAGMRGSLDQAAKYYAALAAKFPKSLVGDEAAKRCERLKSKKDEIEKLYSELAKDHAKSPPEVPSLPSLPALPQK